MIYAGIGSGVPQGRCTVPRQIYLMITIVNYVRLLCNKTKVEFIFIYSLYVQALDEEYLKVDAQFGGVDQRKIFVFAEKVSGICFD